MNTGTESDSVRNLRRDASQSFEPGVDPYNTADVIKVNRQLSADFVRWAGLPPELATCIWCGNTHRNPDDQRFCPDTGEP